MPPLHLSTILTHSPSTLLSRITRLSSKYGGKGHTVLFALSSNFPLADDLQAVVNGLNAFNDLDPSRSHQTTTSKDYAKGRTIGCLVDSFSSTSLPESSGHANHVGGKNKSTMENFLSCSIGIFDSSLCVPFRSELLGRTQPQVGRWHAFRKKDDLPISMPRLGQAEVEREPDWQTMDTTTDSAARSGVDWEKIWSRSSSNASSTSPNLDLLPETLRSIDPGQVQTLVALSSPRPDTHTDVLSKALPDSPSVTLIASPTHFITGRPVTLFLDGQIFGEGAIGLALLHSQNKIPESEDVKIQKEKKEDAFSSRTEFLGVKRISSSMVITAREGNMINELDSSNPTKLLIKAIDLAGLSPSSSSYIHNSTPGSTPSIPTHYFKDDEQFALGVLTPDGQISRTYKITAGDPSSRGGSLSLDAPVAPKVGSVVQFLHFPSNSPVEIAPPFNNIPPRSRKQFRCLTVPEPSSSILKTDDLSSASNLDMWVLDDTFLVPSTQGFVFSPGSRSISGEDAGMWTCSLPGGSVVLEWNES